ncbi:MAG: IS110 family transposase, partial [Devosia sp.]
MEITVGIDVSKARLDVHVHPRGESFAVGNDETGVAELAGRLSQLDGLVCIGLEASGRYERLAVAELTGAGLPVVILNPAQVRAYAQVIGQRAKTDPIDAQLIALFVAAVRPELRPLA